MRALAGDPLVGQRRFLCTPRSAAAQSLAARCSGACKAVNHGARGEETWNKYLQKRDRRRFPWLNGAGGGGGYAVGEQQQIFAA